MQKELLWIINVSICIVSSALLNQVLCVHCLPFTLSTIIPSDIIPTTCPLSSVLLLYMLEF